MAPRFDNQGKGEKQSELGGSFLDEKEEEAGAADECHEAMPRRRSDEG